VAAATGTIFALLVPSPALAAKGGRANKTGTPSDIELCTVDGVAVNGCATGQLSVSSAPAPHIRGTVGFKASAHGSPGGSTPWTRPGAIRT